MCSVGERGTRYCDPEEVCIRSFRWPKDTPLAILVFIHSSQNPWNFLDDKSTGNIFYHNIWSPVLSS